MSPSTPPGPLRPLPRLPLALGALLLCSCDSATSAHGPPDEPGHGITTELVAEGIPAPVDVGTPPGDSRIFVVEQGGRIRIIVDGVLRTTPFLDLRDRISTGGERGLLSLAFHPEFGSNGRFFVNYTDGEGHTRVEGFRVSSDPERADPGSAELILRVEQPFANHNGGPLRFGPDGMLYIGMGDGGSGGDPIGHGQDRNTLHGALLRIDVDAPGDAPYRIPSDNPFVGDPQARDEIWAFGLRNPWRFSFDEVGGLLYVADVGQSRWEEVNAVPAGEPGLNYGWNHMEGPECFGGRDCDPAGLVLPVLSYRTGPVGCAVIGGHVYRGNGIPRLSGHYVYADWCAGWVRSFRLEGGQPVEEAEWAIGDLGRILSIGMDAEGEILLLSSGGGGTVHRLVPED